MVGRRAPTRPFGGLGGIADKLLAIAPPDKIKNCLRGVENIDRVGQGHVVLQVRPRTRIAALHVVRRHVMPTIQHAMANAHGEHGGFRHPEIVEMDGIASRLRI